jgi:hypothetical protein
MKQALERSSAAMQVLDKASEVVLTDATGRMAARAAQVLAVLLVIVFTAALVVVELILQMHCRRLVHQYSAALVAQLQLLATVQLEWFRAAAAGLRTPAQHQALVAQGNALSGVSHESTRYSRWRDRQHHRS